MPVLFQHRIYRRDLQNNPNVIYVFGDNLMKAGYGGQAAQMRGEPNAFGIPTKRRPDNADDAFFSDQADDVERIESIFLEHILTLQEMLVKGKVVVIPSDGLGTGLSDMPNRAPRLYAFLNTCITILAKTYGGQDATEN